MNRFVSWWILSSLLAVSQAIYVNVDRSLLARDNSTDCDFDLAALLKNSNDTGSGVNLLYRGEELITRPLRLGACNLSIISSLSIFALKGFIVARETSPIISTTNTALINRFVLRFPFSKLDFLDRNGKLLRTCSDYLKAYYNLISLDRQNLTQLFEGFRSPFGFSVHYFIMTSDNGRSKANVCPLVFKDAAIGQLISTDAQSTFIKYNLFEFEDLSQTFQPSSVRLNSQIKNARLELSYRVKMDWNVINPDVYANTQNMYINGVLLGFKNEQLFKPLSRLQILNLYPTNPYEFYHATTNKWLKSLNSRVDVDPKLWRSGDYDTYRTLLNYSMLLQLSMNDVDYNFPNEDFCLFQHYPHRQVVLSIITGKRKLNLTCTGLFIIQYSNPNTLLSFTRYLMGEGNGYMDSTQYNLNECEFERRLEECKFANLTLGKRGTVDSYDLDYFSKILNFIGPVIAFPIVAFIGFVLNLLVVLVIRNRFNQKELFKQERLYQIMLINSAFNMTECLISVLSLMNDCLGMFSIFCSSLYLTSTAAFFNTYVVGLVGESMKTCSILTALAFSLERYVSTLGNKESFLKRFGDFRISRFVIGALVFSFMTSVCKIFEQKDPTASVDNADYVNVVIDLKRLQKTSWLKAIFLLHYLLNDFVLLFLTLVVDIMLVRLIRKQLGFKIKVSKTMARAAKVLEDAQTVSNNTNKMVIYSFIVYVLCRLPELLFKLHLAFAVENYSEIYYQLCRQSLCLYLSDLIQFVYMISYICSVLFYYKFNKPFRCGLLKFVGLSG